MFDFLRRRQPCKAEKLLDENVRYSQELSEALAATVGEMTTVFERREHPQPVPMERRKTG